MSEDQEWLEKGGLWNPDLMPPRPWRASGGGPGRGSCNAMPPEDKPKKPDAIERRFQDLERRYVDLKVTVAPLESRVQALETILRGMLKEKDGK